MNNEIVLDIESNGFIFESTCIWTISARNTFTDERLTINPFKDGQAKNKLMDFVFQEDNPTIIFHNGLGFDIFVIMNILGIEFSVGKDSWDGKPCQWIDTFYLSMFLNPDRQGHSVEYFGDILGLEKIDWRKECIDLGMIEKDSPDGQEFKQYHPKMDEYCERDVDVNILIFNYLKKEWKEVYGKEFSITDAFRCGQKSFFLMSCQELTGWKFDIDLANRLVVQISDMMEEIRKEVEPQLPPRELKSTEKLSYKFPAKPFKSSGEFSTSFLKWQEKHNAKIISTDDGILLEAYGKEMKLVPGEAMPITMPMEMSNQDQMKSWFIENGWKPTLWNYKRGPDGKPIRDPKTRDLIKTTPKIQEAGKICPNLMEMEGDLVKLVVKWLSLRNRQSVLQGWLNNPRLQMDGRIGAGRTGIAATHRQKHKVIVNVPKASEKVLLGKEFRSLFICEEGTKIAAGDAAALEGRVQGHYCVPMDTKALTRAGWKKYEDLVVGEDILAYNPETKMKEWTPLLEKCKFSDAETFNISNAQFKVRATANHRWFTSYRNTSTGQYEDRVVETKDLNTAYNLIVNAPMADFEGRPEYRGIFDGKYGVDWIGRIISKGLHGIESFMEGFLIADGNYNNQNAYKGGNSQEIGKGRWKFSQNLGEHYEAALTAAYICHEGYLNITYRNNPKSRMATVTLNKRGFVSMQKMQITKHGVEDVWCPRTRFGSWVMRQGDVITITGNTWRYDNGATAKELLEGDPHSKTAKSVYVEELEHVDINAGDFSKDDPFFKPFRDKSKNIYYAALYGAGDAKIASTAGLPESRGKEISEKFWTANSATKALKDNLEKYWETVGIKKYVPAIDGRILITRKKSALLNTIFQSCGGIAMDYACCFMDAWLGGLKWKDRKPYYLYKGYEVRRVGYYHDEIEFECEEPIAEEVARMIEKAIAKAGEFLKLNVPLAGEGKVGNNWKETH